MKNQGIIKNSTAGNAFIIILITIALLAALTITVTRMSSSTNNNVSQEQAQAFATKILRTFQTTSTVVDKLLAQGCSVNTLSFENTVVTSYANTNSPADKSCWVFDSAGGGLTYSSPSASFGTGTDWVFSAGNSVNGVGTERDGNVTCSAGCVDVVMILPMVDVNICKAINLATGISTTFDTAPPTASSDPDTTTFYGTSNNFATTGTYGTRISTGTGLRASALWDKKTACIQGATAGNYYAYQVLVER